MGRVLGKPEYYFRVAGNPQNKSRWSVWNVATGTKNNNNCNNKKKKKRNLPLFKMVSSFTFWPEDWEEAGLWGRPKWAAVGVVPGYQDHPLGCPLNIRSFSKTDSFWAAVACCSFCAARFLSTRFMEDTCEENFAVNLEISDGKVSYLFIGIQNRRISI